MDMILNLLLNISDIILFYFLPFIIVLGIMIFFHELGHFLVAKFFNVKVLKFALGFGPKIIAKEAGETEYSVRYVPFGGFVKMLGEGEEDEEDPDLPPEEMERAFNHKHPFKRIAIVAAGPVFNLVLALFLFFGIFLIAGNYTMTAEVGEVRPGTPAEMAGMQEGDLIIAIQDQAINSWEDMKALVQEKAGIPLVFTVKRGDRLLTMTVTPETSMVKNEFGEEIRSGLIGIVSAQKTEMRELPPWQAVKESILETWKWIRLTCLVVVKLIQGIVPLKTLGGPIMIGQMTGKLVQESISYLVPFMAIISINLGILNLFPIPILDGGVIIFLIIELIMGRPLSLRSREIAQKIGFSLLILLMVVVFYNDILRLIIRKGID